MRQVFRIAQNAGKQLFKPTEHKLSGNAQILPTQVSTQVRSLA